MKVSSPEAHSGSGAITYQNDTQVVMSATPLDELVTSDLISETPLTAAENLPDQFDNVPPLSAYDDENYIITKPILESTNIVNFGASSDAFEEYSGMFEEDNESWFSVISENPEDYDAGQHDLCIHKSNISSGADEAEKKGTIIHSGSAGQADERTNTPKNPPIQSIKRLEQMKKRGVKIIEVDQSELKNNKYLTPELIKDAMSKHGCKIVLLSAGLGVGKSTATAALMQSEYAGKGVAMCHRIGLTKQLCTSFEADNYQQVKRSEGGIESNRIGTTVHSLPDMLRIKRSSHAFDNGLSVLDESNSAACEILTSTIKNEAVVIKSLGDAIKRSKAFVCADAHMDESTIDLLIAAGASVSDMLLIVVKRPELEGYTVRFFEDEQDALGRPATRAAFVNQILSDLSNGLKVIVTSMSAAFLDELDREAKKRGTDNKIKVTRSTPMSIRESLTDVTYQNYDLVMLSPAMSTGISFDGGENYRHADKSYVILANGEGTGTYQDGLQAMMRERAVKDKTINVYYQESPIPLPKVSKIARMHQNHADAVATMVAELGIKAEWDKRRPNQSGAEVFMLAQSLRVGEQKLDFKNLFIEECKFKGATVTVCSVNDLSSGEVTYDLLQEEKEAERAEWVNDRVEAFKIAPEDEDDKDNEDLKPSLDRQYIEQQAVIDFDELEPAERADWIDRVLPAEGTSIIHRVREIERAFADKELLTEIVKVALVGASAADDDRVQFIEKSNTKKVHWINRAKYTRLLLKAAGVVEIGGELLIQNKVVLTPDSIKNAVAKSPCYPLFTSLKRSPKAAIQSGFLPIDTPIEKVKANPLPFIIDMLDSIGIKTRKARGKNAYRIAPESLELNLAVVNRRKAAGMDQLKEWAGHITEYLSKYQSRKSDEHEKTANTKKQAPDNVISAISVALDQIGKPEILEDAVLYFEPFHDRIKARKLSAGMIEMMVKRWLEKPQN